MQLPFLKHDIVRLLVDVSLDGMLFTGITLRKGMIGTVLTQQGKEYLVEFAFGLPEAELVSLKPHQMERVR